MGSALAQRRAKLPHPSARDEASRPQSTQRSDSRRRQKQPAAAGQSSALLGWATLVLLAGSYLLVSALPMLHWLGWVPTHAVYHTEPRAREH